MDRLRIKEAIIYYNNDVRKENEELMNQKILAAKVFPNLSIGRRTTHISGWSTGKNTNIKWEHLNKLCEVLKVSPNFLFGHSGADFEEFKRFAEFLEWTKTKK